jgi:hypothetical protein
MQVDYGKREKAAIAKKACHRQAFRVVPTIIMRRGAVTDADETVDNTVSSTDGPMFNITQIGLSTVSPKIL